MKELAVIIGRFQPVHNGHIELIKFAQSQAKELLILIGSANVAPNIDNPFGWITRTELIESSLRLNDEEDYQHIFFHPIEDNLYNENDWLIQVQEAVAIHTKDFGISDKDVVLVGHKKDNSSYYLNNFPQWGYQDFGQITVHSSTHIREFMYQHRLSYAGGHIPDFVFNFLSNFELTQEGKRLKEEYEHIDKYKRQFAAYPYPPIFVTVDAVVIYEGHVLLVKRRAHPGKGLWALPGGFLNQDETVVTGIKRELMEETGLRAAVDVRCVKVFDAPKRSLRGRTITHAGLVRIPMYGGRFENNLPRVKGSDDAEKAKWFSLLEVKKMNRELFEDHYSIILSMIDIDQV